MDEKIRLQVYRGVNNGQVYIKRGNGIWRNEFGINCPWFEDHAGDRRFGEKLFDGLVDNV